MFGAKFTLGTLGGFRIQADVTWIPLALLVLWSLSANYFPDAAPGLSVSVYWQMGVAGAAGLFLSLILHELSHSLVARRYGLPIRGITLFLFGGVAELEEEPGNAAAEFWMAAAGPAASFVLAAAFWFLALGVGVISESAPLIAVLRYLAMVNLLLAVFNLVPAFPLDGGRMFRSAVWWLKDDLDVATRLAVRSGEVFGWVMVGLGILLVATGNPTAGLWQIVLGLFLRGAASAARSQFVTRRALSGLPVSRFMTTNPITVPADTSVERFVEDYVLGRHHSGFPVVDEKGLIGFITASKAKFLPREQWPDIPVRNLAEPVSTDNTTIPPADAHEALRMMARTGNRKLMVVSHNELVGVLSLSDLLKFLTLKTELEA